MGDSRHSVSYGSGIENSAVRCKNSRISLSLSSSLSFLSRCSGRYNMVSIGVWIMVSRIGIWISIVSIGVWMDKAVVYNWGGFNFNLLNYRCLVNNRGVISIGKIPGVCFGISFRFSFTLLALCFNSWSFFLSSFSRCSYSEGKSMSIDIRIAIVTIDTSIWISIVSISVWMYKTVVYNRCGFNFNLLNYRSIVYNRGMISISKIPGVCFRISFRFSFTLLAL